MGEGDDGLVPLLGEIPVASDESPEGENKNERTGNVWTAVAHVITAVIGSGVLSLAWSVAQLGWIAGPLSIFIFATVTAIQSSLLADCYRSPDPEHGHIRNKSYMDAVKLTLGQRSLWVCGLFQQTNLYGVGIAYTITSAKSMRAILQSNCYHRVENGLCSYNDTTSSLVFGVVQIACSLIPDFHNMTWLSIPAAIMSFSYSSIALGLGLTKTIGNGSIKGSVRGVPATTAIQKVWNTSQALGDIAFAFPFSIVLTEIQNTLKSQPPENQTMKKASRISILITTFFYLCCGCFGYAAFGDDTPGNLLTGFGFSEMHWLVDFANACVILHLVGGYQVFSQTMFASVDRWFVANFPNSAFANKSHPIPIPFAKPYRLSLFQLCFRAVYVASTTGLAILFPYFNEVLGLLGGLTFWPLAIYFPVEMYFVQRKIAAWSREWVWLQVFSAFCLAVSVFAFMGSVEGLVSQKLG